MTDSALRERRQAHDANLSFALSLLLKEAQSNPRVLLNLPVHQAWAGSTQIFSTNVHLQAEILRLLLHAAHEDGIGLHTKEKLSSTFTDLPVSNSVNQVSAKDSRDDEDETSSDVWLHC